MPLALHPSVLFIAQEIQKKSRKTSSKNHKNPKYIKTGIKKPNKYFSPPWRQESQSHKHTQYQIHTKDGKDVEGFMGKKYK